MSCVAFGCASRITDKTALGITFHRFPQDETWKQKWVDNMKVDGWKPDVRGLVCSIHFKEEDIDKSSKYVTRIKKDAVPIAFPPTVSQAVPGSSITNSSDPSLQRKSNFAVVSELFRETNLIKRKIDAHLKRHRTKNCRIKARIEKLKKSLREVKVEAAKGNPILESLFENALQEPEAVTIEADISDNPINSNDSNTNGNLEEPKNKKEECFRSYLTEELKNISSEDFASMKKDILKVIDANKRIENS